MSDAGHGLRVQADAFACADAADAGGEDLALDEGTLEVGGALRRQRDEEPAGGLRIERDPHVDVGGAFDPQTAGGLLVALPPERAYDFERALTEREIVPARIGSVSEGRGIRLYA